MSAGWRRYREVVQPFPLPLCCIFMLVCTQVCLCTIADALEDAHRIETSLARGAEILLERQEGEHRAEWPYEGVYRVQGHIPMGYRVGGTAIVATSLMYAPDTDEGMGRTQAIQRAAGFVIDSIDQPLMSHSVDGTYDVRGWGYIYGLAFLLHAKRANLLCSEEHAKAEKAIEFFIEGIVQTEIPRHGGWNYARRPGFDQPGPPSPFMTAATLQVLFDAVAQGYTVQCDVIERGLDSLSRARQASGAYVYSGFAHAKSRDELPGAVGRMLIAESTLYLAGRADEADVRHAVEAFLLHWDRLEERRAQHGTHAPPYGVAPYYFFFAHYYAAQAVQLLPEDERANHLRKINERLFSVQNEDGSWNDRVFDRSAAYGTAMAMLSLSMPDLPPPARWKPQGNSEPTLCVE